MTGTRWYRRLGARRARWLRWLVFPVLPALAILAALLVRNNDLSRADVADDRVILADLAGRSDPASVERGRYVAITGDCMACHTNHGAHGRPYAGGYGLDTPFGTIFASNITPDRRTGIGTWTERDFFKAMRHGRGKGTLRYLYPAMPYNAYARLTDRDTHDLWAYMSSLTPINNVTPANRLPFPFNMRLLMAGWNLAFFDNAGFDEHPSEAAAITRGRYLVDGAGHCAACHTPKNLLGGDRADRYLQGGRLQGWFAPEITGDRQQGVGDWSVGDVALYLRHGANRQAVASGPMGEAVRYSTQHLNEDDLRSIGAYLKALPGSGTKRPRALDASDAVMLRGAHVYDVNCSACHGIRAEGLPSLTPGFANSPAIRAQDPSSLLHVLMTGGRSVPVRGNPTAGGMPSFAWKLDDADMAAVLTYLRNSHGNAASPVSREQAAEARHATSARLPLKER